MELSYEFDIAADIDRAWMVLLDVPRIAPCLPGADLTEVVGENHYRGTASVKLGPVKLSFTGEAELFDVDNEAHSAKMRARGSDKKGRGTANADVTFALKTLKDQRTQISVQADLTLAGSIAQYGRASGLIDQMAQQIIATFVKNLETEMSINTVHTGPTLLSERELGSENTFVMNTGTPETSITADKAPSAAKTTSENSISGLSLLCRALIAMIKSWLTRGTK